MNKWLVVLFVFLFSVSLRLWNLNGMGRTWDEAAYVEWGHAFIVMIKNKDFTNPFWHEDSSSGFPPLSKYLYGAASTLDVNSIDSNGKITFNYDYTHARLVSVLFSSLAVVLIVLMGWECVSPFVGVTAGTILSMLPFFLGLSQTATLESLIVFFFTATVFSLINLLKSFSKKKIIITGVLFGLTMSVKYSNILLVPLIICIYLIWYFQVRKRRRFYLSVVMPVFGILLIGFLTFFILWPMPWFHLKEVLLYNQELRNYPFSVPEVFFGKLMLIPKIYFFVYFAITTPLLILTLFLVGLKSMDRKRTWILTSIIIWFMLPFLQSFYNYKQHGIRHIIEIYAPLSIVAGIGLEYFALKMRSVKYIKPILLLLLVSYLFLILFRISPYYLDYFNEVVGGTKNVYEKRIFQLGWWGEGVREAAYYVGKYAKPGSTVGIALSPPHVMPPLPKLSIKAYSSKEKYDYVIVNYYNILREGFNDGVIKEMYKPIYLVKADKAILVTVYKSK